MLEDIAAAMGQKGTMSALRRTCAGLYTEADAHTLEEIQAAKDAGPEALQALMLPVDSVFESLPLLVVEPLLTYRFGRVQETVRKAVSKGLRITVGYALLLVLLGCIREWLAAGTMFGVVVSRPVLPMASMPAGGFIVLGVLCAVWRALAQKRKAYLTKEARNLVDVHSQKEADREQ